MFENEQDRKVQTGYSLPKVELKEFNVMIGGKNFFDQPVKSSMRTNDNIQTIATDQGDDYTIGCLVDYNYLKNYYSMIAIDLSKQQALSTNPKAIQQINFTGNLDQAAGAAMLFIIKEAKQTILDFSQGNGKVL